MIVTDLGVFDRSSVAAPFKLIELAPNVSLDHVKSKTEADVIWE